MKKVYRLDTDMTSEENVIITKQMTEEDVQLINELDYIDNFDEINNDGKIVTYMICTEEQLNVIKTITQKYKVGIKINDITNEFLKGVIEIHDEDFQKFKLSQLND